MKNKRNGFYGKRTDGLFGDGAMTIVAAVVTLLLQGISFITTLKGAEMYFGGIFFLAPIMFALAVQITVYFLANSVRRSAFPAKVAALIAGVLCSNYFSYIGVYNAVNSPVKYYEDVYYTYRRGIIAEYEKAAGDSGGRASEAVTAALNEIAAKQSEMSGRIATLTALEQRISEVGVSASAGMSAPKKSEYENYEDYAAAYKAYVSALSDGGNTEKNAEISALLSQYGFGDISELTAELSRLTAESGAVSGALTAAVNSLGGDIEAEAVPQLRALIPAALERDPQSAKAALTQIFAISSADITAEEIVRLSLAANAADGEKILPSFEEISKQTDSEGEPLIKNPLELKSRLSTEIRYCLAEINSLMTATGQGTEYREEDFPLTPVYLIPVEAIVNPDTRGTAIACLSIAVLTDWFSLLFAGIYRKKKSVLAARTTAGAVRADDLLFEKNIIMALSLENSGDEGDVHERLQHFIAAFTPTSVGAEQGYSLMARQSDVSEYGALIAFLMQFGILKILTPEYYYELGGEEAEENILLLKTKLLLWYSEKYSASLREGRA